MRPAATTQTFYSTLKARIWRQELQVQRQASKVRIPHRKQNRKEYEIKTNVSCATKENAILILQLEIHIFDI
jgi:uncharacterized membrane protein